MFAPVNSLPDSLRRALEQVNYHRRDINIEARETASLNDAGSTGCKAFVILVNLETGQRKTSWGSWGGPNMFNPHNAVDLDSRDYPIPPNGAVIRGSIGNTTFASILVSPSTIAPLMPKVDKLADHEARILYCFKCIKGGQYRRIELAHVTEKHPDINIDESINDLVARGYLKRNRAGAVQITTAGKNAHQANPLNTY